VARSFRLTGGTIRRLAEIAVAEARLHGRAMVLAADIVSASRSLGAEALDTLAARVTGAGTWDDVVVDDETSEELRLLEQRCRQREQLAAALPDSLGSQQGAGVRALFAGPSGTGKSLAAQVLASALQKDLYRLDLSTVVNKYLGETEKNVDRLFSRAEELDVVLLIDEGDALLARRTDVRSSNDRYANLETNYLLQRIEAFDGVLVITTNARQRIDEAFERRIDATIDFTAPGPTERYFIWRRHLAWNDEFDDGFLQEAAARCALTGGQIRNAVLHATMLALEDRSGIRDHHLEAAVQREYRKLGSLCPLRAVARHA
jgi:SpoVK/Ycf46/Vps4 family AAA+-type ATPase